MKQDLILQGDEQERMNFGKKVNPGIMIMIANIYCFIEEKSMN